MSLTLRFLGTAASRPTIERSVPALALVREGDTFLFDCGEGTQRQMMRYGVAFGLGDIFFTHFHTDHFLGVIGLMRTMAMLDRTEPLRLWGPRGATKWLQKAEGLGMERLPFALEITELAPGDSVPRKDFRITAFPLEHRGTPSIGYALIEDERRGRFNPDLARSLGIPEGPQWGKIHKGESITLEDGRVIAPEVLVGPTRSGRRIVITGDTRPLPSTVEIARGADVLVHESTFAEEEAPRARETGHSTAREAAEVARQAEVRRLVLTHFSARYSRDARELEREASAVFPQVTVAKDGLELEVPYADEVGSEP
jgi:ribonuclease Z